MPTLADIDAFQRDGVILVKGLFKDRVDALQKGIERNMAEPGEYAAENLKPGEGGRFFDDYCNWSRIPEFENVIRTSPASGVALISWARTRCSFSMIMYWSKSQGRRNRHPGTRMAPTTLWGAKDGQLLVPT